MSKEKRVYILGGYQTDFAKNYHRLEKGLIDLIGEVTDNILDVTKIESHEVASIHVGNFIAELNQKQGHLGGFFAQAIPKLHGVPVSRHEAACASGGISILAGMADIESRRYDTVLVVGVELEKNLSGDKVADHLGVAAWYEEECRDVKYPWPKLFSDVGEEYDKRYGLDEKYLKAIAKSHFANAKSNPNAQTRNWTLTEEHFGNDENFNPTVSGMIRKQDCSQITDGATAVILCNYHKAKIFAKRQGKSIDDIPYINSWGHTTGMIKLSSKLDYSENKSHLFPHLAKSLKRTIEKAGLENAMALDCIETHDCFTTSAYMAIDHFGITAPGENWKVIEDGIILRTGKLPINPSGGLMGGGHPVGATGVRMLVDAYKQLTNQASDYQIENCQNVGILNIGGSVTTCVSFVVSR